MSRSSYAELHGTANLGISAELDWGRAIVRPYMTLADGLITARFNLGAYYANTSQRGLRETPVTYDVAGYDILHALTDPVGETYAIDAGVPYLTAVEDILIQQGFVQYIIDPTAAASTLPAPKVWPFVERTTWLTVVNELLSSVGYAGVWSDWEGRPRCHPYQPPRQRPSEWPYEADGDRSTITPDRTITRDLFATPNRWVFYQSNNTETSPVEGNGMWTYINQSDGPTSVDARDRVISKVVPLEAADHASLVRQAQERIDADMRGSMTYTASTSPNPLHWHFDRIWVNDPKAGAPMDMLATQWTLRWARGR
ncbi:hypothetical protein [Micromonospora sp. 4G55]|uniref:hypothetical protein n=1 Tax=Micromonospora sp. 4G55 TaxID=2806102 RepID=UPI001A5F7EF2|nr:hypothetical protein [Micromonospora sp. 4G55]MBM0257044.1 hypothetical protein [Micromonospora sp. 4G55]